MERIIVGSESQKKAIILKFYKFGISSLKYSDFPSYVRNEQPLLNRHVAGAADLRICAHDGDFDADPKLDKCKRVQ